MDTAEMQQRLAKSLANDRNVDIVDVRDVGMASLKARLTLSWGRPMASESTIAFAKKVWEKIGCYNIGPDAWQEFRPYRSLSISKEKLMKHVDDVAEHRKNLGIAPIPEYDLLSVRLATVSAFDDVFHQPIESQELVDKFEDTVGTDVLLLTTNNDRAYVSLVLADEYQPSSPQNARSNALVKSLLSAMDGHEGDVYERRFWSQGKDRYEILIRAGAITPDNLPKILGTIGASSLFPEPRRSRSDRKSVFVPLGHAKPG